MGFLEDSFPKPLPFDSAEELIEALRLRNDHWRVPPPRGQNMRIPGHWVFRGHGDDERWELIPGAHRSHTVLDFAPGATPGPKRTVREQRQAEFNALLHFMDAADLQGLPVPDDSSLLRVQWARRVKEPLESGEWPPPDLYSAMGLAQHFGVPTRLLDWSQNPFVAAYFAARDAALLSRISGSAPAPVRLSVWALQPGWIYGPGRDPKFPAFRVRMVSAPAATNINLRAQTGKFSLVLDDVERLDEPFVPQTLDEVLLNTFRAFAEVSSVYNPADLPVLRRWTLPAAEAPKLLRLLSYEGVTGAAVMPGYAGVTRRLEEWRLWDKVP